MKRNHTEDALGGMINSGPRRPLFGWFPRLGLNLLAFAADAGAGGYRAENTACGPGWSGGGTISDQKCCGLARRDKECCYPDNRSKALYRCAPGFQKTWWFCMVGREAYGCGECSSGNTCYIGPWDCSIMWKVEPC